MDIKKQILSFRSHGAKRPPTRDEFYRQYFDACLRLPSWDEKSAPIYTELWRTKFLEERMKPIPEGPDVPF